MRTPVPAAVHDVWHTIIVLCVIVFFSIALVTNVRTDAYQHFTLQARDFVHGSLAIRNIHQFGVMDTAANTATGKYYWPLGVFPSVLLVPFVYSYDLIGIFVRQGFIGPFITLGVFLACLALAKKYGYSQRDALYLAFAFVFASVYALPAYIPFSWFFGQAVGVALLFLGLYEFHHERRWWVIGIAMGFLIQTRLVSSLASAFFLWQAIRETHAHPKRWIGHIGALIIPMALSVIILMTLNHARFGNVFDTGYPRAAVGDTFLTKTREKYGYFNIANVPTNIHRYFLMTFRPFVEESTESLVFPYVEVDLKGAGLFFVAPIFAFLFLRPIINRETLPYWVVSLGMLGLLLMHYTAGYGTFGPRYVLDFLPLWYILLLISFRARQLRIRHFMLILGSAMVNMYLILTNPFFMYN